MPEIFVVRHGQASFGSDNYDQLSELGWRQARWLGEHFAEDGVGFDRVVCGDLQRHRETATGICEGLGLDASALEINPQLNEFDFLHVMRAYGERDPQAVPAKHSARADFYRFLKKAMHAWANGEITGAETWLAFEQRVETALGLIGNQPSPSSEKSPKGKTLVVSSGGAIAMMVRQILGAPSHTVTQLNMQIKNTAVTRLFAGRSGISLHSFNHVPHLENRERRDYITYS